MEKSFVDFAIDAAKDHALGEEFHTEAQKGNAKALSAWFHGKGYHIPEAECQKMTENKHIAQTSKVGVW